ncbi:MAG: hypothetical protein US97_C0046G0007 [Microgenomates group bacterium GW2011_GWF1_38_5]|nr:MAG: hypothetical protein US97_C0046G0007 [Microgenomates group bacterium GW2011_GWF1_38_5]
MAEMLTVKYINKIRLNTPPGGGVLAILVNNY